MNLNFGFTVDYTMLDYRIRIPIRFQYVSGNLFILAFGSDVTTFHEPFSDKDDEEGDGGAGDDRGHHRDQHHRPGSVDPTATWKRVNTKIITNSQELQEDQ